MQKKCCAKMLFPLLMVSLLALVLLSLIAVTNLFHSETNINTNSDSKKSQSAHINNNSSTSMVESSGHGLQSKFVSNVSDVNPIS